MSTVFNPEFSFDLIDDTSAANTLGRSLGETKKSANKASSKKLNSKESQPSLPEEVASKEGTTLSIKKFVYSISIFKFLFFKIV